MQCIGSIEFTRSIAGVVCTGLPFQRRLPAPSNSPPGAVGMGVGYHSASLWEAKSRLSQMAQGFVRQAFGLLSSVVCQMVLGACHIQDGQGHPRECGSSSPPSALRGGTYFAPGVSSELESACLPQFRVTLLSGWCKSMMIYPMRAYGS